MFQQQVEEIKFEEVYIQRLKQKAQRTNKIRDWLLLLKAYQENNLFQEKDRAIHKMTLKFVLNEEFWLQQIKRKQSQIQRDEKDIEFIMLALEDGYYQEAACLVNQILIKQLNRAQNNSGNLRPNYLIAKIQKLISIFKRSLNFFPSLRNYYKTIKNDKKVRQTYMREIKFAFNNFDIIYDQYLSWQKNKSQEQKSKKVYEQAKQSWEEWNALGSAQFYNLSHIDRSNFDCLSYLKIINKLQTDFEKLRHLRIICLSRHQLVNQYFELLEFVNIEDEEVLAEKYKSVIDIIPQIQIPYLRFLVRRINKHEQQTQSEEYYKSWTQKVQFFRKQITCLIDKPRLTPKTQESIKQLYYNFWIDVETSLVKNKQSVCQLFEVLLQVKQSVEAYVKYSRSMISLGFLADAKQILKRCCEAFKYHYQAYKQYQNFISIYGSITDAIQFRKLKNLERDQQKNQSFENHGSHLTSNTQQYNKQIPQNSDIKNSMVQQENLKQLIVEQEMKDKNQKQPQNVSGKNEISIKQIQKNKHSLKLSNHKEQDQIEVVKNNNHNIDTEDEKNKIKMHTDSGHTLFIKGYPQTWRQEQIKNIIKLKDHIKQIRLVEKKGVPMNYCYVDMLSAEVAQEQMRQNEHLKQYYIAISRPPASFNQDKTLFLGGIPLTATVQKIKDLFQEEKTHILDVRIKIDQHKNVAYIDFDTPEIMKKVHEKYLNKILLIDDKKVLIREAISRSINTKKDSRVVILKQLSFKATEKDIVKFFQNYDIEDIYIAVGQNNKSKGFAFVKFKNNDQFNEALSLKNGIIKNRTFQIHRSDRDIQRPNYSRRERNESKSQKTDRLDNNYFNDLFK